MVGPVNGDVRPITVMGRTLTERSSRGHGRREGKETHLKRSIIEKVSRGR